ncbi:MAG: EAL domain-containing protein [Azoarcus sp.]|jgi:EAL domain-containing protein (putative c-di-GMP-specific phosphodiesterase class I)|nr:EAL domain-containing protein [Azoarcus sp.]
MKSAPPSRNEHGEELFIPDFSEGAEVGVYLALLELIDEGLLITGDENIIDANSAACRLLGRSYRQLAGQPLADLFADGHAFLEARERLLIRGEARGTLRLVLPDGRGHDFPYIAAPRLRPGIHAIVLGYERLSAEPTPTACPLALHFQPQVDARNGKLYAGEALLHWQPPGQDSRTFDQIEAAIAAVDTARAARSRKKRNAVSPVGSEEMELDAWALSVICRAAATWPHLLGHAPVVSINISASQLPGGGLPKRIRAALAMSRLDPRSLELSIDAAALSLHESDLAPTLRALAEMRVRLALDNFGRDPVSVAQLSRYRFSVLKLDANLAAQIGRNDGDTALIEAIAQMCAPLGIRVMARGVTRRAQQDFLLALGCDLQQGPFIGTAQEEHVFAGFLSERLFC